MCNLYLDLFLKEKALVFRVVVMNRLKKVKSYIFFHKYQRILGLARALQITVNPLMLWVGYYMIYLNSHSFTSSRWWINSEVTMQIITQIRMLLRMKEDTSKADGRTTGVHQVSLGKPGHMVSRIITREMCICSFNGESSICYRDKKQIGQVELRY